MDGCKAVQIIKIEVKNVENRRKAGGFRHFVAEGCMRERGEHGEVRPSRRRRG